MIQKAKTTDAAVVAELAVCMWDSHTIDELISKFESLINNEKAVVFLVYDAGIPIGFAQCQLRYDYVEGTDSSPVGYLEGIFVREEFRKHGYAKELLSACEVWAVNCNCTEFASDCELGNNTSIQFHLNIGFTEANRIVCFTKKL